MITGAAFRDHVAERIRFTFSRASGSGGQNVNKVNTKVTARLLVGECGFLSEEEKGRIRAKLKTRMNAEDEIVIQVQDERSQYANREKAIERFSRLLTCALKKEKKRRKTKPTRSSVEKRILAKKTEGEKKRRRKLGSDDL